MPAPDAKLTRLFRSAAPVRSRDLVAAGITRSELSRMAASGRLERVARGLYALPGYRGSEHQALATVARRSPGVVFCLLTALRLHDLTTQAPFEVWIGIGNKSHPPRIDYPKLRVVRFSHAGLRLGVEKRKVDGVPIHVTNAARTVADCFKFRSKVGLDVAMEALRDALRSKKATTDELWHFATFDRVANVMRPYLEAVA
ncbi:MAG: AbiEi antitoxin N-terminal domain-containing protein [Burkholderiales bacterium]|nr:AbiEi antitoxin N-terminal domain-containing protein [Burkholderiales bacterium]